MDTIRETQEQLARLHFSLDKELSTIKFVLLFDVSNRQILFFSIESDECQKKANENMSCLMQKVKKNSISFDFQRSFLLFQLQKLTDEM